MDFFDVKFETSFGRPDQLPESTLPEIVFSGRSNVGKSSMINKVFNRRQIARVSSSPGKTATINFFLLDNIRFVDLPGYGYAKVPHAEKKRWSVLMEHYFKTERNIAIVFQLIDMRHPPTKDDLAMIEFLIYNEFPFVLVLTKMDKLSKKKQSERLALLQEEIPYADQITMIPFSSVTGEGTDQIHEIIDELSGIYKETDK